MTPEPKRVALWARVSTDDQESAGQLQAMRREIERRGWTVVKIYDITASAWKGGHHAALSEVYADAQRRRYDVLMVWALDRLTREGALSTLETVSRLGKSGVQVISLQEPWTETAGELRDLLMAIVGWVAQFESKRRSERIKAGNARRKAAGLAVGRKPGAKDVVKRKKSGYNKRWETEQGR